jgi:signal transduction histidine kinase
MVIRLLFDSLDLDQGDDEDKNKDLSVIREKLDHLEQIAGRILDFGKSREAFRKNFALQEIIEDAALLVRLKLEQSQVDLHIKDFRENPFRLCG